MSAITFDICVQLQGDELPSRHFKTVKSASRARRICRNLWRLPAGTVHYTIDCVDGSTVWDTRKDGLLPGTVTEKAVKKPANAAAERSARAAAEKPTLSEKTALVLVKLRAEVEDQHEPNWGVVYLDNARPAGMSARSFAGHLGALEKAGLYWSYEDDSFGRVWIGED